LSKLSGGTGCKSLHNWRAIYPNGLAVQAV
jgi:hypothetical protein